MTTGELPLALMMREQAIEKLRNIGRGGSALTSQVEEAEADLRVCERAYQRAIATEPGARIV